MASNTSIKPILSIAGSDPSGGAGIQADLKTFCAIGVYGCAAITCLTAQNTRGVAAYEALSPDFVTQQIKLVLEDIQPSHIKIGMVGNGSIAAAIGQCLATFKGPVFYDPVLLATSGHSLFNAKDHQMLLDNLFPRVTVITPNTTELQTLTEIDCAAEINVEKAAEQLLAAYPKIAVIAVTGGHYAVQSDTITDFFFMRKEGRISKMHHHHPRIKTNNTHGTGCTFSSAFAAYHLLTGDYEKAFSQAGTMLAKLVQTSADISLGAGHGPLHHHLFDRDN